jgi:ribonuclease PH
VLAIVRPSKRAPDALRPISFERAVSRHAGIAWFLR